MRVCGGVGGEGGGELMSKLKKAYKDGVRGDTRKAGQYNKTLYLSDPADVDVWDKAQKLFPFFLSQSVSQFCNAQVKAKVAEIERTQHIRL